MVRFHTLSGAVGTSLHSDTFRTMVPPQYWFEISMVPFATMTDAYFSFWTCTFDSYK